MSRRFLLMMRKQKQINIVILGTAFPFILLGMMVQASVQYDNRSAWEEQKQIWQQLFLLAPDIKDGATVFFLLPDDDKQTSSLNRNGQRVPFDGGWDISTGLNMLYGKFTLKGDSLNISSIKHPDTGSFDPSEDKDAFLFEKTYHYDKIFEIIDAVFGIFILNRISDSWIKKTVPRMKKWINS